MIFFWTKLRIDGIRDEALSWFRSYMSQRQQQVSINITKSSYMPVLCGVPQRSVLRPLCLLLFINDLPFYTSNVSTDMYADDTTLYDVQSSQGAIEKR